MSIARSVEGATCLLDIHPTTFQTSSEAVRWLSELGTNGWYCTTDAARPWDARVSEAPLLTAEVADGARSRHVRCIDGRWQGWEYVEGAGKPCRKFEESYRSTERGGTLRYATYWHAVREDEVDVLRPYCARFLAWGDHHE